MEVATVSKLGIRLTEELNHVIAGKQEANRNAVLTLLCGGHLLIEDVPGVGKTTLAKAIARAIGGQFSRIQFTPDLLPSDVTGTSIYNQRDQQFEFRPGPVFCNVLLADEINRATPKTQSALLEAMEERNVTADGAERALPDPFMVIATQNNVEMAGTFPLPEAQMDRFFARLTLGYPDREAEKKMLEQQRAARPLDAVQLLVSPEELKMAQEAVRLIHVSPFVQDYVVELVRATRTHSHVSLGASPRASLHLQHAAQGVAALAGREEVFPEDVKSVAVMVLAHRIIPTGEARSRSDGATDIIRNVLNTVPTPIGAR